MKFVLRWLARLLLYGAIPVAYALINFYGPFRNTLIFEMPEPTEFGRQPENYYGKKIGAPIYSGFAKRDITPDGWPWLGGYHPPHPGLFVNDRLWVKSLALRDQKGNKIVIVSCDLIGLLPDEIGKIKSSVSRYINPDHVFITCTHTHSGPDTMGIWGAIPLVTDGKNKRYMKFLREQIRQAITDSVLINHPSTICFAAGELKGYVHGRHENLNDESVGVIQVLIGKASVITLVNFACHPDDFNSLRVSADWPYYLYERLDRLTGGETMLIQGAIGGVQPSDHELQVYHARALGEDLADAVFFKFLKNPIATKRVEIKVRKLEVYAPLENKNFQFGARTGALPELRDQDGLITAEVNKITIGPAEILTAPGELFPKIWWHVKPLMRGRLNLIFGLTNGEYGYILLPEDFDSGRHRYHTTVSVGPVFGTEMEKALKKLITDNR